MFIKPDWPIPQNVRCLITTRKGGVSSKPYDSMNTALHVVDSPKNVNTNRQILEAEVGYRVVFPHQTHSTDIVELPIDHPSALSAKKTHINADGMITHIENTPCAVQTADCLPVLICDKSGAQVVAVHAGWRGLANGILINAFKKMHAQPHDILVYLGPAISGKYFEVGDDVVEAFNQKAIKSNWSDTWIELCVTPKKSNKYLFNLYQAARCECEAAGLLSANIFGGGYCTYQDEARFYSYRRDGETGRMTSVIWKTSSDAL